MPMLRKNKLTELRKYDRFVNNLTTVKRSSSILEPYREPPVGGRRKGKMCELALE